MSHQQARKIQTLQSLQCVSAPALLMQSTMFITLCVRQQRGASFLGVSPQVPVLQVCSQV